MIAFSFNDPAGEFNLLARASRSTRGNPLGRPGLPDAVRNSMVVAFLSTIIATILGTLIGLALVALLLPRRGAPTCSSSCRWRRRRSCWARRF